MSEKLKCIHGCHPDRHPAVLVAYVPEGCNCFPNSIQSLCIQHWTKIHSTGPITVLEDLTLDKMFSHEEQSLPLTTNSNGFCSPDTF
jgi:hypothetical protein